MATLWEMAFALVAIGLSIQVGSPYTIHPFNLTILTGDPLRFHSHFVATVFTSPVSKIEPMQIVAFGRLGTATKKSHLICGWDKESRQVTYYSIEWAGLG
jgi:tRNA-splicing endonuclease subunit Sen34